VVTSVVNAVLGLSGPVAYLMICALAFGESAAFIGLFLPGETALIVGGVLASQGHLSLPVLLVLAILAAVAGDSVGYEVGRRGGPALRRSRLGRLIGARRWAKAEQFLVRRGGVAVFLGRWVGVMRPLVPSLAGMGKMPYRRFLTFNILGGVPWATAVVLGGYAAGNSFGLVSQWLGRGSLFLGSLLALAAGTWFAFHLIAKRRRRHDSPDDLSELEPTPADDVVHAGR
jgi:membrane protein DedA with SNARE-associated domain